MKPSDEEALLAGLRALRENRAGAAPSPRIETALLSEFRRHKLRNEAKFYRKPLLWIGVAAAAALLIAISIPDTPAPVITRKEAPPIAVTDQTPDAPAPVAAQPVRRKVRRTAPKPVPPIEIATEFLALPYAPSFTPEDRGQLVRVRLPRESMRSFGLPVNQDRIVTAVKADVWIGEDGVARAIRFVQ